MVSRRASACRRVSSDRLSAFCPACCPLAAAVCSAALGELRARFVAAAAVDDLLPDASAADLGFVDSVWAASAQGRCAVERQLAGRSEPVAAYLDAHFAPAVLPDDCSVQDDFDLDDSRPADLVRDDSAVADFDQGDSARSAVAAQVRDDCRVG